MAENICDTIQPGSASPPITKQFSDKCANVIDVEGIRATVYDIYGSPVDQITFGTYSPAATSTYGASIQLIQNDNGFTYEIIDLPTTDSTIFPERRLSVQWEVQDTNNTVDSSVNLYSFFPPLVDTNEKHYLSWPQCPDAVMYRVDVLGNDGSSRTIGYTNVPVFCADAVAIKPPGTLIPGNTVDTTESAWRLFVNSAGVLVTQKMGEDFTDLAELVVQDTNNEFWTVSTTGAGKLFTTYAPTTTVAGTFSDPELPAPDGALWALTATTNGNLVTTLTDNRQNLFDCEYRFCVVALGPCFDTVQGDYTVIKTYEADDVSTQKTQKDLCIVTGVLADVSGRARPTSKVNFFVHHCDVPQVTQNTILHRNVEVDVSVDCNGRFSVPLIQGALVTVEIPSAGYYKKFVVPSSERAELSSITGVSVELRRGE